MKRWALLVVVAILLVPMSARADSGTTFRDANQAYQEGRFAEAAAGYETLVAAGIEHEDLYYNLGNAYFRDGKLGPAIYNYERALRIDPDFEDANFNLEVAREAVAERVTDRLKGAEADPWWVRAATFFSLSELTVAFLLFDVLFFAGLIALRFLATGFARTGLIATTAFVGAALLLSLVLLRTNVYVQREVHQGVVVADSVVLREGAHQNAAERGKLHPGVRVRVRGRDAGWLRIGLANGMEGWVPDNAIGRL